jgi:hypothetical protein
MDDREQYGERISPRPLTSRVAVVRVGGGEASALFRKHGFAPQTAGGWARGDWIEVHDDGRRYITERSRGWPAEQEVDEDG